jgi:hypothetical protein
MLEVKAFGIRQQSAAETALDRHWSTARNSSSKGFSAAPRFVHA